MSTEASSNISHYQTMDVVEEVLSSSLVLELGGADTGEILLTAGKRRRKEKNEKVSDEIVQEAKKVSKTEKKRIEQIRLRKDKEEKRDQYLNLLNQHVLPESHRQLLTSSKNFGQSATLKGALKKALKRHKAGLSITAEEHELLFPQNAQQLILAGDLSDTVLSFKSRGVQEEELAFLRGDFIKVDERDTAHHNGDTRFAMPLNSESDDLEKTGDKEESEGEHRESLINFNDIFSASVGPGSAPPLATSVQKKRPRKSNLTAGNVAENGAIIGSDLVEGGTGLSTSSVVDAKGNRNEKVSVDNISVPLGLSLKQQLEKFKLKVASGDKSAVIQVKEAVEGSSDKCDVGVVGAEVARISRDAVAEEEKKAYVPVRTDEPFGPDGRVVRPLLTREEQDGVMKVEEAGGSLKNRSCLNRDVKIQAARLNLPVCGMEQEIVEAITLNDVVILCGETGSGKSTQVPQFLFEAGFGNSGIIGITQPRRVAATSTAERVGVEMGEPINSGFYGNKGTGHVQKKLKKSKKNKEKDVKRGEGEEQEGDVVAQDDCVKQGGLVGYQIRFDASTVGEKTKIKFMTDGILLREVTSDLLLRQYSVILLDEAHERNVNTDILLGMISRTLPIRRAQAIAESLKWSKVPLQDRALYAEPIQPLKLVIMSATMRVEDFRNPRLFPSPPPIIKVDARQYPVTVHFSKRTEVAHYLNETFKKICQIHRRLPDGGILVFLTGKREIMYMCRKINKALNRSKSSKTVVEGSAAEKSLGAEVEVEGGKKRARSSDSATPSIEAALTLSTSSSTGSTARSGVTLRGMDDDEIEGEEGDGGAIDGQDDDMFIGAGESDDDEGDYESEEDGEGYDSLGEDEIFLEEKAKRAAAASVEAAKAVKSVAELEEEMSAEGLRNKMLREVLGLPESSQDLDRVQGQEGAASGPATAGEGDTGHALGSSNDNSHGMGGSCPRVLVLPLFAMMTAEQQSRVFKDAPKGHRMIVIATNVAETSITIPGIRYVVDSGRQKERVQDLSSGVSKFEVKWVAQASAEQRKGRAGRTGPGHCYRLYSSAFYDQHMVPFQPPEIATTSLEDLLLQMRSLGISEVENFPFPTAPPPESLTRALDLLINLGAISQPQRVQSLDMASMAIAAAAASSSSSSSKSLKQKEQMLLEVQVQQRLLANKRLAGGKLTELGKLLAQFPIKSPFEVLSGSKKKKKSSRENEEEDLSDEDEKDREGEEGEEEEVSPPGTLWHHTDGDSLSRLRAIGAFAYTAAQVKLADKVKKAAREEKWAEEAAEREHANTREEEMSKRNKKKGKKGEKVDGNIGPVGGVSKSETKGQRFKRIEQERSAKKESQRAEEGADVDELKALCTAQNMHQITLQRALDLRGQLSRSCASVFLPLLDAERDGKGGSGEISRDEDRDRTEEDATGDRERVQAYSLSLLEGCAAPPTAAQEVALRQVLLTGYCDSVARRVPLGAVKTGSRHRRLTEPLYIHPHSVLYRRDPSAPLPEYIVYGPLITNTRGDTTYMTCVTVVAAAWIPMLARDCALLHWSSPLATPPPFYDAEADQIGCYVIPKYGVHNWELAPVKRQLLDCLVPPVVAESAPAGYRKVDESFRWFARLLLEGSVLPELRSVLRRDRLKDSPALITQMKPSTKVSNLVRALVTAQVHSRKSLLVKMKATPDFLSEEVQQFLVVEVRKDFRRLWTALKGAAV